MSDAPLYTSPKVWTWNKPNGGQVASINRPRACGSGVSDLKSDVKAVPSSARGSTKAKIVDADNNA
jgi:hypothetical protein